MVPKDCSFTIWPLADVNHSHLYNVCWSADSNWFVAVVTGGMGFDHNIIAFEAHGTTVFDLNKYGIDGCRPDLSPDGTKITQGQTDWGLYVADIDLTLSVPRVADIHGVVKCRKEYHISHTDLLDDFWALSCIRLYDWHAVCLLPTFFGQKTAFLCARFQCTFTKSLRFESIARTVYSSYNASWYHLFYYLMVDILSLNQRSRYDEKPKQDTSNPEIPILYISIA